MKTSLFFAAAGAILLASAAALAQSATQSVSVGVMQVKEINLAEIDSTHVRVAVDLDLVPAKSATLKDLHLCSLSLNGLPVFAEPLNQEIVLRKNAPTALPPLYVTVLFRDLTTVEPLRRMVEKQTVHVQGEMVAGVRLNFAERLALHTQHPEAVIPLSQDVPAAVGSTPFERNLALAVLSLIDSGLDAKDKASKVLPGMRPAWIADLEAAAQDNVFEVESSYAITRRSESFPVVSDGLGFRVGAGKVVTTAEALAPWKYDAEFMGAVKSGEAKIDKKNADIQLLPVGSSAAALKLGAQDFTVEMRGDPEEDSMAAVGSAYGKVRVLRRASPSALAVLSLHAPATEPGLTVAPAGVVALDSWDQAAVFRLRLDPASGQFKSVEVLQVGARRDGKGIQLSEPVDPAVFGSPIVTPDGVIGLVQDEQSGAFLPAQLLPPPAPTPNVVH